MVVALLFAGLLFALVASFAALTICGTFGLLFALLVWLRAVAWVLIVLFVVDGVVGSTYCGFVVYVA